MSDVNNGGNTITSKCVKISEKFIRAINKNGIMVNLIILKSKDPANAYEQIYGQEETETDKEFQFKALLTMNPPEQVYKDLHLEFKGNAILGFISYSLQTIGLIDESLLGYLSIPKQLIGSHVRIGDDYYRIDEVSPTSVFMGFPLYHSCSLTFIETKL